MNPLTCQDVTAELMDFLDGTLAPTRALSVGDHLSGCTNCQNLAATYGAVPGLVASAFDMEAVGALGQHVDRVVRDAVATEVDDALQAELDQAIYPAIRDSG